jgi:hypothetical protein
VLIVSCSGQVPATITEETVAESQPTSTPLETKQVEIPTPTVEDDGIVQASNQEIKQTPTVELDGQQTSPAPPLSLDPGEWKELPIIPEISEHARQIYEGGVEAGNDPRVFAKVGDCQNVPSMFLSIFDYPGYYSLGEQYDYLQATIDWYSGSFSRESEAVRRGFNAASVVSPLWADPASCEPGETPLDCEIRISNPSIAIISLETWWAGNPENYEKYVRQIIEGLLEHDILPIVATKADNLEGDNRINEILVGLAVEYQIPVWNFWRAVQPLPGNGLLQDRFHLTFDENHFDDEKAMQAAWPWRNLTALQVLDRVRIELAQSR